MKKITGLALVIALVAVGCASDKAKNLAKGRFDVLKILGNGPLTKNLKVSAHRFSESAREKIQQAGGEVLVLPGKAAVVKNRKKSSQ